ncbi:MAG: hypothetical protein RR877_00660 [Aurantimicrobium sp.]|uniref:hypothetical protein n=1 Tax=Aurantimicrobium sp. TaxID=1930784 RepID=UPI002FC7ABBA
MSNMQALLKERLVINAKIRSLRVIKINRYVAILMKAGSLNKNELKLYNKLHEELQKGIPNHDKVDDVIDQLECILDL